MRNNENHQKQRLKSENGNAKRHNGMLLNNWTLAWFTGKLCEPWINSRTLDKVRGELIQRVQHRFIFEYSTIIFNIDAKIINGPETDPQALDKTCGKSIPKFQTYVGKHQDRRKIAQ
jgi:hypothetical protein